MRTILASFVFGLTLAGTFGCGSAADNSNGPSAATVCADLAKAQCHLRESCSLGSFWNDHVYGDPANCETRATPSCISSLGAQDSGQTPTNIEACVALYSNYTCTDFRDNNPTGACAAPAGKRANGAACGANGQCASTFCHLAQYQTCGVCSAVPAAGAACQYGGDCGRNMACATPTGATTGTCADYVASGGTCLTGSKPCQAGLACIGEDETAGTTGTCQAQANTVNAACDRSRKTAANCDAEYGLTCVPTAAKSGVGTCQAITLVASGQTCGAIGAAPITGEAVCNAGGLCVKANATDATGTCVAAAADGAACDSDGALGPPCGAPARCVPSADGSTAGTCKMPDATKCN